MTAILVDDEPMALSSLERMVTTHCDNVQIIGKCMDAEDAVDMINQKKPHILFLDIAMPKMDGFTLLNKISYQHAQVIFVTAYDEYALQAFKAAAADYLLKPIDKTELIKAVDKVAKIVEADDSENHIAALFERLQRSQKNNTSIGLPTMEGLHFVKTDNIVFCKSDGNYTEIKLVDGEKIVVSRQIKFLEEKLDATQFVRVHKSYLINLSFVSKYLKGRGGTIVMSSGDSIPVSVRRKSDFLDSI